MEEVFSPLLVMRGLALRIELLLSSRTVYKAPPIASQTPALVPPLPRLDPRGFNVRRNEAGEYFVKGSVVNAMRKKHVFYDYYFTVIIFNAVHSIVFFDGVSQCRAVNLRGLMDS